MGTVPEAQPRTRAAPRIKRREIERMKADIETAVREQVQASEEGRQVVRVNSDEHAGVWISERLDREWGERLDPRDGHAERVLVGVFEDWTTGSDTSPGSWRASPERRACATRIARDVRAWLAGPQGREANARAG